MSIPSTMLLNSLEVTNFLVARPDIVYFIGDIKTVNLELNDIIISGDITLNSLLFHNNVSIFNIYLTIPIISSSFTLTLPIDVGLPGYILSTDGTTNGNLSWRPPCGDVFGPISSTDDAITRFDGTTGKLVKNSTVILDDNSNISGANNMLLSGNLSLKNSLILEESGVGTDTVTIQSPSTLSSDISLILPSDVGTLNQVLINSSGTLSWYTIPSPGGADTQVQFNDAGSFNATANLVFNKASGTLTTTNIAIKEPVNSNVVTIQSPPTLGSSYELFLPTDTGSGPGIVQVLTTDASNPATATLTWEIPQTGIVTGPGSSLDNSIVRFTDSTGNLVTGSEVIVDDSSNITGANNITLPGSSYQYRLLVKESGAGSNIVEIISHPSPTIPAFTLTLPGSLPTGVGSETFAALTSAGVSGNTFWTFPTLTTGGSNTQVQYHAVGGTFEGISDFTYNNEDRIIDITTSTTNFGTLTSFSEIKTLSTEGSWTSTNVSIGPTVALAWSPELSLLVIIENVSGDGPPYMYTSADVIDWTSQTSPIAFGACSVVWSSELNLFCAASRESTVESIMISSDGMTWVSVSISGTPKQHYALTWSPELGIFCAVGSENVGTDNKSYISSDGATWISSSIVNTLNNPDSIAAQSRMVWSPDLSMFCLVSTDKIHTSIDGLIWISQTVTAGTWNSVAWSSEHDTFVVTSLDNTGDKITTSSNGEDWTVRTSVLDDPGNVVWSPQMSLFIASGSNGLQTSEDDGTLWTTVNTDIFNSIDWVPELNIFIGIGVGGSKVSNTVFADSALLLEELHIGTRPITDITIVGQDFNLGNSSNSVSIGRYSTTTIPNTSITSILSFEGSISGTVSINVQAGTTSYPIVLPDSQSPTGVMSFMSNNGLGELSWSGSLAEGLNTEIQFNKGGVLSGTSNLTYDKGLEVFTVGVQSFFTGISTGVSGNAAGLSAGGELVDTVSQRKYKMNETSITEESSYDVADILKLNPKFFTWKKSNERELGFIVEDITNLELSESFIYRNEFGIAKNIKDRAIIAGMIQLAKEQQITIDALKKLVN
jgi:hypothetical protein